MSKEEENKPVASFDISSEIPDLAGDEQVILNIRNIRGVYSNEQVEEIRTLVTEAFKNLIGYQREGMVPKETWRSPDGTEWKNRLFRVNDETNKWEIINPED